MSTRNYTYYTLALTGNFDPENYVFGYIDKQANRYHDSGNGLCVLLWLRNSLQLRIAQHVLELKRIFIDLRLEVVVSQRQWDKHEKGCFTRVGQLRNRFIKAADKCHVLKETEPKAVASELLELFSTKADRILYASMVERNKDANRLRYKRHRAKTQYFNPRNYSEPPYIQSARRLASSLDFLLKNRFKALSDLIPDELLAEWQTDDIRICAPYFCLMDDVTDLLRISDPKGLYLPLKVFAYMYARQNDFWAFGFVCPEEAGQRFVQFQTLIRRIERIRMSRREMIRFDVFDVAGYDTFLEQTAWVDQISKKRKK